MAPIVASSRGSSAEGSNLMFRPFILEDATLPLEIGGSMAPLKGSQRRHLRGLAHPYSPAVQIGKEGLTDPVIAAIDASLAAHELIKVKIAADRDGRQAMAQKVEAQLDCECVGAIGHMAIFYRRHPDPEHRRIVLPR